MRLKRSKVMLIPYPAQGHVAPMMKLASVLVNHGLEPIMITPEFIHSKILPQINPKDGILCLPISDGLDEGVPRDFFAIEMAMEKYMPFQLEGIIRKLKEDDEVEGEGDGIVCVIVDLLASWAIKVANHCGLQAAGFWPAMQATYHLISAIPELIQSGIIDENGFPLQQSPISLSPNQPTLSTEDLPWLIGSTAARNARFKFWRRTLDRSRNIRWLLINTFPEECHKQKSKRDCLQNSNGPRIIQVGALTMQEMRKSAAIWSEDRNCLDWLDKQKAGSVMYISFGTWVSPIGEAKMNALALALEASGMPFLWVLRPAWLEELPPGYVERVSGYGKVVPWVPQLEVLQHDAVACYLTHCGWNSTMEAIQFKKRLLCYPVAGDQFVNCNHIVNAWRIGVRIDDFRHRELEDGFHRVMDDKEMENRILHLHEKVFGEDNSYSARASLATFVQHLKN